MNKLHSRSDHEGSSSLSECLCLPQKLEASLKGLFGIQVFEFLNFCKHKTYTKMISFLEQWKIMPRVMRWRNGFSCINHWVVLVLTKTFWEWKKEEKICMRMQDAILENKEGSLREFNSDRENLKMFCNQTDPSLPFPTNLQHSNAIGWLMLYWFAANHCHYCI